jgi:hypothetical protein
VFRSAASSRSLRPAHGSVREFDSPRNQSRPRVIHSITSRFPRHGSPRSPSRGQAPHESSPGAAASAREALHALTVGKAAPAASSFQRWNC